MPNTFPTTPAEGPSASPIANTSYLNDATNFSELWEMCEKEHFYGLLTPRDAQLISTIASLNVDQANRLKRALNWGREQIDNILREKYQVSSLTYSSAPETLKNWNWRYAQWQLEKRRYRAGEPTSEAKSDIDDEVVLIAKEQGPHSLTIARGPSPIATAVDSHATAFDHSGQFDNLIPGREANDIWPDGLNE
jgi:hypothetical protein